MVYPIEYDHISYSKYISNNRLSITLNDSDGWPILIATVNISNTKLDYNEVAIKNWGENQNVLELLIDDNIITPPHRYVKSGYVDVPICYIVDSMQVLQNICNQT